MILNLQRIGNSADFTVGVLREDCKSYPLSFTLEDEYRPEKVKHETRIPAGRYQVKFREVLSGMTKRYRKRYNWFTWHLELQDVPNFKYVYIHTGNNDDHTSGCILVGYSCDLTAGVNGFIGESRDAYEFLYKKVKKALEAGEEVWIDIKDLNL